MKRTLLLLALVVGAAMAEEVEEVEEEGRATGMFKVLKKAALASVLGPLGVLVEIGLQVVILIALILFITNLKDSTGDIFSLFGKGGDDYGYYGGSGGYDLGHSGSSYASTGASGGGGGSGYYKRSVDSAADHPMVQRLTARIHEAIDNFNY